MSADGLTLKERNNLRKLQNEFLGKYRVKKFIEEYGENHPLFGENSPSAKDFREFIVPQYTYAIKQYLKENYCQ